MKTFDEWIDEYIPNRLHDSHVTFTLNDMKEAFNGGYENLNETIKKVLSFDRTELEYILEAIKCYFMCDMSVQCVEMQEEHERERKRMKNLSEKIKFMLSKF